MKPPLPASAIVRPRPISTPEQMRFASGALRKLAPRRATTTTPTGVTGLLRALAAKFKR